MAGTGRVLPVHELKPESTSYANNAPATRWLYLYDTYMKQADKNQATLEDNGWMPAFTIQMI
ncbi:hypothetical protein KDAU_26000 [Dictyobacter aurantiacus]|uniref:Uncharacterized protein n=1 Tax=Dictyobacter aurantiacus TaxID=1936993 RepID=A0A401ZEG4_9CHLR|nr:hypothetical protein KDAU_26000 [Dictyobacter aurantiacus]